MITINSNSNHSISALIPKLSASVRHFLVSRDGIPLVHTWRGQAEILKETYICNYKYKFYVYIQ